MIYYFIPDYDKPSWGIGMLYHHVNILNNNGFNAKVLHEKASFKLSWLQLDVPIEYLNQNTFSPLDDDILIIPEILAGNKKILDSPGRKIVFVQNCFAILANLEEAYTYKELGYEHAFTYLPHLHTILKRHFDIEVTDIPPFVAPYYYLKPDKTKLSNRKKRIILFPKPGSYDHSIMRKMLLRKLGEYRSNNLFRKVFKGNSGWELIELENKSHEEVAKLMKESTFFVSVNTREAFNSSVPEAMATGCIALCYEAYGPKDFLKNGRNAFVFPNNYVFPLIDKLFALIDDYDNIQEKLAVIRANAYQTACAYTLDNTEVALIRFFYNF